MKKAKFDLFTLSAYCITIGVTFGSAINFGFVFGSWFYPVLGEGSVADQLVSWLTGMLLGLGAFGLFLKSEKALKTILKLRDTIERWVRGIGLVVLNLMFVSVGIAGLFFRATFLSSKGVGFLLYIGVAVEFFPFLIGLVLWPIQNPSAEQMEEELGDAFDREVVSETYSTMRQLPLKARYAAYTGNFDEALDAAVDRIEEEPEPVKRRGLTSRRSSHGAGRVHVSQIPTRALNPATDEEEEDGEPMTNPGRPNPFMEGLQMKGRNPR